jgi:hypothetical protein
MKAILISAVVLTCGLVLLSVPAGTTATASTPAADVDAFPRALDSYGDEGSESIWSILTGRVKQDPFNLVATLIFLLAIIHTFMTARFMALSHKWEHEYEKKIARGEADRDSVHLGARLFHFLGEVEAVFGIWAVALIFAIIGFYDWHTVVNYIGHKVNFTEPAFVVVIMTLAATRPILRLSENLINRIANLLGGSLAARWLTTLTIGPVLGSFITEPAAMTICALVLARSFYELDPSPKFKYATLGLLFVNISVGGTLTHFAAPPVLMVAATWDWTTPFMMSNFGWKAVVGILISNGLYYLAFRGEVAKLEGKAAVEKLKVEIQERYLRRRDVDASFEKLAQTLDSEQGVLKVFDKQIRVIAEEIREQLEDNYIPNLIEKGIDESIVQEAFSRRFEEIKLREMRRLFPGLLPPGQRGIFVDPDWDQRDDPVPIWVTVVHVFFMAWTIVNSHYPPMFIVGMLFFLGFAQITEPYQNRVNLKPAMLVGFFLAGLVIHGGVQGWWIAPILGNLAEVPLMLGATLLTAFNDNAAITYLATLVPGFTEGLKYAVVAGAVAGGGLTIIANAPNPAGVSLLKKYFNDEVSPAGILAGASVATVVMFLVFVLIR